MNWQRSRSTNVIDDENTIIIQLLAYREHGMFPEDCFIDDILLELIINRTKIKKNEVIYEN